MLYFQGQGYKPAEIPQRIISLVPSQTELLYFLGVSPIAQTIFCVHPTEKFKSATKIGGTKKLNIAKILALKPDLIIGNKEENDQTQIEELAKSTNVWLSDIYNLDDAFIMMEEVGLLIGKKLQSKQLVKKIKDKFNTLASKKSKKSCLYLIWREPYMAAGQSTFINAILQVFGYKNVLPAASRYPAISSTDLLILNPEIILLSSEPYPFKQKHIRELQKILPKSEVRLVNGELFSWYGPRLLETIKLADELI